MYGTSFDILRGHLDALPLKLDVNKSQFRANSLVNMLNPTTYW